MANLLNIVAVLCFSSVLWANGLHGVSNVDSDQDVPTCSLPAFDKWFASNGGIVTPSLVKFMNNPENLSAFASNGWLSERNKHNGYVFSQNADVGAPVFMSPLAAAVFAPNAKKTSVRGSTQGGDTGVAWHDVATDERHEFLSDTANSGGTRGAELVTTLAFELLTHHNDDASPFRPWLCLLRPQGWIPDTMGPSPSPDSAWSKLVLQFRQEFPDWVSSQHNKVKQPHAHSGSSEPRPAPETGDARDADDYLWALALVASHSVWTGQTLALPLGSGLVKHPAFQWNLHNLQQHNTDADELSSPPSATDPEQHYHYCVFTTDMKIRAGTALVMEGVRTDVLAEDVDDGEALTKDTDAVQQQPWPTAPHIALPDGQDECTFNGLLESVVREGSVQVHVPIEEGRFDLNNDDDGDSDGDATNGGGTVHRDVRGVRVMERIAPSENAYDRVVLTVDLFAGAIHMGGESSEATLGPILELYPELSESSGAKVNVAMQILAESGNPDGRWSRYLCLLGVDRDSPLYWSDTTLAQAKDEDREEVLALRKKLTTHWNSIVPLLQATYGDALHPYFFRFEGWVWAHGVVMTRSVEMGPVGEVALVPVADMFNHDTDAEPFQMITDPDAGDASDGVSSSEGRARYLQVIAPETGVDTGGQILIRYGDGRKLFFYGLSSHRFRESDDDDMHEVPLEERVDMKHAVGTDKSTLKSKEARKRHGGVGASTTRRSDISDTHIDAEYMTERTQGSSEPSSLLDHLDEL